jgi:polyisoprenoid-binding protein YceI
MKNIRFLMLVALLAAGSFVGFRTIMVSEWTVVLEDVSISFQGKNAKGTVSGLEAEISFSPADLANSSFKASIDARTLETSNKLQTKHANSDKWMDTEKYPSITFTSKEIRGAESGYEVVGDLDMHGLTKEITMPFTFAENEGGGLFEGTMHIVREDWNIGKGGFVKEVDVTISVPVVQ